LSSDATHPTEPLAGFTGGIEWMVDASGCAVEPLTNRSLIGHLCDQVISDLELTVVGRPIVHSFAGPGGVTALYLLSESHLTCHTYPEYGFATFNLYCCRQRPAWPWQESLGREFRADQVRVRTFLRELRPKPVEVRR
jgi:S-adenosylmethionine decarboxylase